MDENQTQSTQHKEEDSLNRIRVTIKNLSEPEVEHIAQALQIDLERASSGKTLSFFTTHKFPIEAKLEVKFYLQGEARCLPVLMSHMNEQFSSGRVMSQLPVEGEPFPAMKFYRCYTRVLQIEAKPKVENEETQTAEVIPIGTVVAEPEQQAA